MANEYSNRIEDYLTRCKADDVTRMAHIVFEKAGISSKQLAYMDAELSQNGVAVILREKEPTAYLLRRNFATHMHAVGLDISEMQYLIGHNIDDAYESRNDYVDEDRIYDMYLKLRNRPLLNPIPEVSRHIEYESNHGETIKIYAVAKEPGDSIRVSYSYTGDEESKIEWYSSAQRIQYPRSIDILKQYQSLYSK